MGSAYGPRHHFTTGRTEGRRRQRRCCLVRYVHTTGVYLTIRRQEGAELGVVGFQLFRCRTDKDDDRNIIGDKERAWSTIVFCVVVVLLVSFLFISIFVAPDHDCRYMCSTYIHVTYNRNRFAEVLPVHSVRLWRYHSLTVWRNR